MTKEPTAKPVTRSAATRPITSHPAGRLTRGCDVACMVRSVRKPTLLRPAVSGNSAASRYLSCARKWFFNPLDRGRMLPDANRAVRELVRRAERSANMGGRFRDPSGVMVSRSSTPVRGPVLPSSSPAYVSAPILADIERLLSQGQVAEAFRVAYLTAEDDIRRAFGLKLPRQWTHREFLSRYLRPDMGYVTVLLPQLHALFEPARYGNTKDLPAAQLMPLMRALYQEPPLRSLGLLPTAGPSQTSRSRVGSSGGR
jgi:hypothetical protein